MSKLMRFFIIVFCIIALAVAQLPAFALSMDVKLFEDAEQFLPFDDEWVSECEDFSQVTEKNNIEVWAVEDYELESMYGDEYVLRRSANTTEAYVTYYLPYVQEIEVTSYNWPSHIAPFEFYFSRNGEEWTECEFNAETISNEDDVERWTKIIYKATEIFGVGYVKICWPMPSPESNDWWNPYLGSIKADIGTPEPAGIIVNIQEEYVIPRYDAFEYTLSGYVADQLDKDMGYEVLWSGQAELPEGVALSEDGLLSVSSLCEFEGVISVIATANITDTETITKEVEISLKSAIVGDVNYDSLCDENDLQFTIENFRKTSSDSQWDMIRLADINSDGIIDIVDLAYIAYNCATDEEIPDETDVPGQEDEEEVQDDITD